MNVSLRNSITKCMLQVACMLGVLLFTACASQGNEPDSPQPEMADNVQAGLRISLGNTGHGRRQYIDRSPGGETRYRWGDLKYADRTGEMPEATAKVVPPLYNIWMAKGAVYWYGVRTYISSTQPTADNSSDWRYGFDINFMTYGFEPYVSNHVYVNMDWTQSNVGTKETGTKSNSDACFLRRIDEE